MSADSRKPLETPASDAQVSPGWDPFTVWRERVHKPRCKAEAARSVVKANPPLAVLDPIKHSS